MGVDLQPDFQPPDRNTPDKSRAASCRACKGTAEFQFSVPWLLPGRTEREIKGPIPNFQLVAEMQDQGGTNSFQHVVRAIEPRTFGPTLRATNRDHRAGPDPTGAERKTVRRSPLKDRNNNHAVFLPVQGEHTRAPNLITDEFKGKIGLNRKIRSGNYLRENRFHHALTRPAPKMFKTPIVHKAVPGIGSTAGTKTAPSVFLPRQQIRRAEQGKLVLIVHGNRREANPVSIASP